MNRLLSAALAVLASCALATALPATVVPQPEPLHSLVVAPAGFVATPAPRPLSLVQSELSPATLDDVFIDGQLRETLSYLGPTPHVSFGASKTYSGLGAGPHEIKIVLKTLAVYVDGFTLTECGQADASAVEFTTTTTTSQGDLSLGPIVTKQVQVGADDRVVSVLVEGGSQSMTVRLLDPLGLVVATGGALLEGFTDSGVDASVSQPGNYTVQVLRPLGVTSGKVEISIARTSRVP